MKNKPTIEVGDLPNLKRQYIRAVKAGKDRFETKLVCGKQGTFLVDYAKYVIEYLEQAKKK